MKKQRCPDCGKEMNYVDWEEFRENDYKFLGYVTAVFCPDCGEYKNIDVAAYKAAVAELERQARYGKGKH